MIELAKERDIPRLRQIWKACFGDPDSYLDFYFSNGFPLFKTLVDWEEGEIASMLTVVPAFYQKDGECFDAAYLYAVGTAPEQRGKGAASRLLSETQECLRTSGIHAAALFPAAEGRYRCYERLGDRSCFSVCEVRLRREECRNAGCAVDSCGKDLFLEQSAGFLSVQPVAMKFAAKSLGYFYDEIAATEGEILWIAGTALQGYAVCYKIKGTLVVKETNLRREQLESCAAALMNRFGADELFARIPADSGGPAVRHGMLCVLDSELERLWPDGMPGYMNLVLD